MITENTTQKELRLSIFTAATGLLLVILPVFFRIYSDSIHNLSLFGPILGGGAWIWFLIRRFGRGLLSKITLILIGAPIYFFIMLVLISLSMNSI